MNNPSKIKPAGASTYQHRQAIGGAKEIRTPDLATGSSVGLWDCRLVRRRQRWRSRDLLSVVSESVHHASQHRAVRFVLADWSAANAYCLRVGLSTAMIPVEMLPTFWAEWVAPWAPQLHIGQALQNIIFADASAFSARVVPMLIWRLAGVIPLVVALLLPRKTAAKMENK